MRVEIKFKYTEHMRVEVDCDSEKEARKLFHKYVKEGNYHILDNICEIEPFGYTEREGVSGIKIKETYQTLSHWD